jgi:sulfofructose kinase
VLRHLAERYGATPVVTLGARGGLYWRDGRIRRFAAPRVRVRDTTGAGDAFHGAFAAGLSRGLPLAAAIDLAARAAARACSVLGGQPPSTAGAASRPGRSGRS